MANGQAQQAGVALSALSAGLQGRGPQFTAQRQDEDERRRKLALDRQKTVFTDSFAALNLVKQGRFDLVTQLGQRRLQGAQSFPEGDFKETRQLLQLSQLAEQGDEEAAANLTKTLENNVEIGRAVAPELFKPDAQQIVDGQLVTIDRGQATAAPIAGFKPSAGKAADRSLRERQIAVSEATEQRQATKLSAGLENALLTAQERVVEAQRQSNEFDVIAADFETRTKQKGGVALTFSEFLKTVLGTQDDVTEFRRRFNKVRIGEGLKNLPPGPASDVDVAMAFRGVPKENAGPEQVASFLRGAARMARFDAGFNQFKADFISNKSSARGLGKAWRKSIDAPAAGRKVTVAEIYETAQNRGITPEDVMQQLGITNARVF